MKRSIDEQNAIIIQSMFGRETRTQCNESVPLRINEEMMESVRNHRKVNGLTSKITIIRNYLRTKKFVKTIHCI